MSKLHPRLEQISPNEISTDPCNPRGLNEEQITTGTRGLRFDELVSSIQAHGVLVPLIVKPDEEDSSRYILIDGERRFRAAKKANLNKVPVLTAKDEADARELAYHIHMLTENWDKAAQTTAIKRIVEDIKANDSKITANDLNDELKRITKLKPSSLRDIIALCEYDDDIIKIVISKGLSMSFLVQIMHSFVRPLNKYYPDVFKKYGENKLREILVEKAIKGKLSSTRYLMDTFKIVFKKDERNLQHKEDIEKLLCYFLDKKGKNIKTTFEEYQGLFKVKGKVISKTSDTKTKGDIKEGKQKSILEFKPIKVATSQQQTTIVSIRKKFESIGSRFSEGEKNYIGEALECLENGYNRAAVVMIWASGIERILNYVEKNFEDFNEASKAMTESKKSVWKYYYKNFNKNATNAQDIRETGREVQLICYLCSKGFVTVTECEKLLANYKTRCNCAHPTDIELRLNELLALFENVYDLIMKNENLN